MRSQQPKVLHVLADRCLLQHVIDNSRALQAEQTYVVYGHGGDQVQNQLSHENIVWVEQTQQLGTGHAVNQALINIPDDHQVLVLYGDVPLTPSQLLQSLLEQQAPQGLALITVQLDNPQGYGRIVRDSAQKITCIVEEKDADSTIRQIQETNSGILCAQSQQLKHWLSQVNNRNQQGEYYLTDVIALAVNDKQAVHSVSATQPEQVAGVNNRQQLANLERYYQLQIAQNLMEQGLNLRDPARFDVRGQVQVGQDVHIDINVLLEGKITLGDGVQIGANCVIRNSIIAKQVIIHPNCVIENAHIEQACEIGPFARIRPDTHLEANVKIGNFVEIKKSRIDVGSKISHLSYIGDTQMGKRVNIGAGTITCNYDGANKFQTTIGDDVFVGSDTQLIAPVTIANGVTIGAGATVTKDAPADSLVISRSPQRIIPGWERPKKQNK